MTAGETTLHLTLLGTGSSGGVPRLGNDWGDCDPANPKNRRRRCALLVEAHGPEGGRTRIQVDAGADLREQLLDARVDSLDAVLITHAHADHIFGLDDLRQLALRLRRPIDVYFDAATAEVVLLAFGYCFYQAPDSSYPPFCREHRIDRDTPLSIDGAGGTILCEPLVAEHGDIDALGFRFADVVYLPDIKRIKNARSWQRLASVDTLIIDALRRRPHPSHFNLDESLAFIERVAPRRAILTNMHSDLDYEALRLSLPDGVEPGYDGLRIDTVLGFSSAVGHRKDNG